MGIFSSFFGSSSKYIGNVEPICPYCENELEKKPGRKKKCPHCDNYIFVRTRPKDEQKILIRDDQIKEVEKQWAIKNGNYKEWQAKEQTRLDAREALKKKFNTEPSESDIDWYLLNDELLTNFENNNWGFYRSTKFQMAEHLRKEHKYQDALKLYFEVLYIDLNGPINVGKKRAGKIFEASMGMAPPGVVKKAVKMTKKLDMETDEIENKFLNVAKNIYNKKFPIQPDEAWLRVKRDF